MQQFRITISYHQIIASAKDNALSLTLVTQHQGRVYRQLYSHQNLPSTSKHKFTSAQEMYVWLDKYKECLQVWEIKEGRIIVTFQPDNVLQVELKRVTDAGHISSLILKELWEARKEHWHSIQFLTQQHKQIKQKEKETQDKFTIMNQKISQQQDIIKNIQRNQEEISQSYRSQQQTNKNSFKEEQLKKVREQPQMLSSNKHNMELNRVQKDLQSMREELSDMSVKIKKIEELSQTQEKKLEEQVRVIMQISDNLIKQRDKSNNKNILKELQDIRNKIIMLQSAEQHLSIQKMKKDMENINNCFENEVKIKEYSFVPDQQILKRNLNLKFLNHKTIKCFNDVKDYTKVSSVFPFGLGRFCFRISLKNIKNNGLMIGICTKGAKQSLDRVTFNDQNIISINSCGYVVNRGKMATFSGKIKTGDTIKMVVSRSLGEIRWFCNDIELTVAQMGTLSLEEIYPLIGLGNFCDEVEFIPHQLEGLEKPKEPYRQELARLNKIFKNS